MDAAEFRRGVADILPVLVGLAPFGFVVGVAAADTGLDFVQAVGMSAIVFAGGAQLATFDLLNSGAPLAIVVVTAVVVNARLVMYSASIAPYFRGFSLRWRALLAAVLTDPGYALSVARYRGDGRVDRRAYFLGIGLTIWAMWVVTTAAGVVVGGGLPEAFSLEFAVPLVFMALATATVDDRPTAVAAVAGGAVSVAAAPLPLDVGLLVGAAGGIAAGFGTAALTGGSRGD